MNRNKILFLSYYFPPHHAIASVRSANIAKYLAKLGWDVTVITPNPTLLRNRDDSGVVSREIDAHGVKCIYTGHLLPYLPTDCLRHRYGVLTRPLTSIGRRIVWKLGFDFFIGWIPAVVKASKKLRSDDVDVILATGGPWTVFHLAERLGKRLHRPFVLDYRDLWTTNDYPGQPLNQRSRRMESRIIAQSAAVSVISPSMASSLDDKFKVAPKFHVVPNGYDPSELEKVKPLGYGHFAIVYTGILYPPQRDVGPLMLALRHLDGDGVPRDWRFHYYGDHGSIVAEAAKVHGLQERVVIHGIVPRSESLSAIRGANLAVVITSVYQKSNQTDKGIITGKVFEPIGMGIPVLVIAPLGADIRQVIETVGGGYVFTGTDIQGISNFFRNVMCGQLPLRKHPERYSWPVIIQRMHDILHHIVINQCIK